VTRAAGNEVFLTEAGDGEDDRGIDLQAPGSIFLVAENRGIEAELLVASSWRWEAHRDDMGERGMQRRLGLSSLFSFVGKGEVGEKRRRARIVWSTLEIRRRGGSRSLRGCTGDVSEHAPLVLHL
jgi:hypothetical protein